jgi:hypothetical protein
MLYNEEESSENDSPGLIPCFVTSQFLSEKLKIANKSIFLAKPGLLDKEASALQELVTNPSKQRIECRVFIDAKAQSIRCGYGTQAAFEKLLELKDCRLLSLHFVKQIRMALLIVDEREAFAFTPVGLAWEKESDSPGFPNGFHLNKDLANKLQKSLEATASPFEISLVDSEQGLPPFTPIQEETDAVESIVKKISTSLKKYPAVDPTDLRKISTYRNKFKIVKTTHHSAHFSSRVVGLRNFAAFVKMKIGRQPGTVFYERLKTSWDLFLPDELAEFKRLDDFRQSIQDLEKHYLRPCGDWGKIIEVPLLEKFKQECHLLSSSSISENFNSNLKRALERSKNELAQYLTKQAKELDVLQFFLGGLNAYLLTDPGGRADLELKFMTAWISEHLKFPTANQLLNERKVKARIFDLSDEMLEDGEFCTFLREHAIEVDETRDFQSGYEKLR